MSQELTPETLTIELIRSWDGPQMRQHMASPLRDRIIELIAQAQSVTKEPPVRRPLTAADEQALFAQQQAEERQRAEALAVEESENAETQRLAAEAEANRKAAEEAERIRLAAQPKKVVVEYQVKDEKGNPIGRPTHLEAATEEEMRQKLITAHEQATRAFHRLKSQKVTFEKKALEPAPQVGLSDAELLSLARNLKSDDPQVVLDAQKKINQSQIDKELAASRAENARLQGLIDAANASNQFLADHRTDFSNVKANVDLITQYLKDNEMPWTRDNLEVAFHAVESQLAPVDQPVTPAVTANPTPVVPSTTPAVTPAASVVQSTQAAAPASALPTNAAPATTTPAANTATQHRPGVNAGIVPGESSGTRPDETSRTPVIGLTITDVLSWDGPTMRKNMANKALRPKIEAVLAAENTPEKVAAREARKQDQLRRAGMIR